MAAQITHTTQYTTDGSDDGEPTRERSIAGVAGATIARRQSRNKGTTVAESKNSNPTAIVALLALCATAAPANAA